MDWIKIKLSESDLDEIENAEKQVTRPQLLKRLQCIKLKNEGWKHEKLSKFFGICPNTISNWLQSYERDGIQGLLEWGYEGRVSVLTLDQQELLTKRNKKKPFESAKEAKAFIDKEFGIEFHLHWVQKLLKKNFIFHSKK